MPKKFKIIQNESNKVSKTNKFNRVDHRSSGAPHPGSFVETEEFEAESVLFMV